MSNTTVTKVDSAFAPVGLMGQHYLASGVRTGMRLWKGEVPGTPSSHTRRDYETVGFVLEGRAELEIEGQVLKLQAGDSYVVPRGSLHRYNIREPFSAVEATSPPAHVHARDERNVTPGAEAPAGQAPAREACTMEASEMDLPAMESVTSEQVWIMTALAAEADSLVSAMTAEGEVDLGGS